MGNSERSFGQRDPNKGENQRIKSNFELSIKILATGKSKDGIEWTLYDFKGDRSMFTIEIGGETEEFCSSEIDQLVLVALGYGIVVPINILK